MSRPRLNEALPTLFEGSKETLLIQVTSHPDFQDFAALHGLTLPLSELIQAFTHTSFAHEFQVPHQELLEFLGDSVLQLILTDELHARFPQEGEGRLSKLRSALVNEKTLAAVARGLGLPQLILVGKGEWRRGLTAQDAILADTLEALLGQLYRHQGFESTRHLFLRWLAATVPTAFHMDLLEGFDAKSKLQEAVLAKYKKLPVYASAARGDLFEIKLLVNGEVLAQGVFPSKKSGEKELAQDVLTRKLI